ncbi:hypothetical protein SDC9_122294 [bioreactor metagenome]|uniref:Uncharacterized protein n=1 Tax=bioreactor metagenome TaxID=1076179 RepID=A0A645CEL8_9ZZZZ
MLRLRKLLQNHLFKILGAQCPVSVAQAPVAQFLRLFPREAVGAAAHRRQICHRTDARKRADQLRHGSPGPIASLSAAGGIGDADVSHPLGRNASVKPVSERDSTGIGVQQVSAPLSVRQFQMGQSFPQDPAVNQHTVLPLQTHTFRKLLCQRLGVRHRQTIDLIHPELQILRRRLQQRQRLAGLIGAGVEPLLLRMTALNRRDGVEPHAADAGIAA